MDCIQCKRTFLNEDIVASISGSIMGDEHTDSYYYCSTCNVYTVVSWWDNFTGVETMEISGPISKEKGDKRIEIIRQCSQPWDKKCRCDAQRRYFNDTLD